MTVQVKPTTYTKIWASSGTKITPDDFKIGRGWEVEKPPYETMNWVQNRQDQWIAHANQRGIPEWDAATEYKANKSYVTGATNGRVWRATANNVNVNPETDVSGTWVLATYTQAEADTKFLSKSANLSDLTNLATARTNLNVYSKTETYSKLETYSQAESDSRYCGKSANLADVPDKAMARTNLAVYSQAQVDAMFPAGKIEMFAMTAVPSTHIVCDGRLVNMADEPRLYAAIGNTYTSQYLDTVNFLAAIAASKFCVPDMRAMVPRGLDSGRGIDTGRTIGSYQQDAQQNITGEFSAVQREDYKTGAFYNSTTQKLGSDTGGDARPAIAFDSSRQVRTANEVRVKNVAVVFAISR